MKHRYRTVLQRSTFALIFSGIAYMPASAEEADISWRTIPVTFWFCEVVANGNTRRTLINADSRDKARTIAPGILNIAKPTSVICH